MSKKSLSIEDFTDSAFEDRKLEGLTNFDEAPDGGLRAWLVVVGVTLVVFSTVGVTNSWGVFQAYYEENSLSNLSPSTIAWIGSSQYALVWFPALATGRLFDLGYFKIPCFAASCVLVACMFVIAECTQYWQFFLTQGLVLGVCCGFMLCPALAVVSHWFSPKRRGFALGITSIGSSSGSTVFPAAAQKLIPLIGFKWTVLLTYISVSAVEIGISGDFVFYIISISNAGSAVGRLLTGIIGDKIGAINTIAPFTALAGIMTIVWPHAKSESQLIAIVAIYGFSCGAFSSLWPVPIMAMGDIKDAGRRAGMFMSLAAFGAIAGPPISGALISPTKGTIVISIVLMLVARYFHLRRLWGKF
ncbi:hypothetical protein AZE42_05556 [Rhizopogon vesiculosus]|uniref:Major facilitator superfamily (MFS) profile domain-containing protein n=1 Tax=Rhizopogon vesiculosus TaxID=180088 RepID=A0A1J8QAI4_9AGAM|nr:hypothetical protein AZE42_05556 [Rhizopogon vesiculosus]